MDETKYKINYDLVIPCLSDNVSQVIENAPLYLEYLGADNLFLITDKYGIEKSTAIKKDNRVTIIDEDTILPIEKKDIKQYLISRNTNPSRAGWYYQQFLKMGFAFYNSSSYYLVWDADTIPLRNIDFFTVDLKVLFNVKSEHHVAYFNTIKRILDLDKIYPKSFITEHMMVNSSYMKEMLSNISNNEEWFWSILDAIDECDLSGSGFSEFETFGNYIYNFHEKTMKIRHLYTIRHGGLLLDKNDYFNPQILQWLSKSYDTISFEKRDSIKSADFIPKSRMMRKIVPPKIYVFLKILIVRVSKKIRGLVST